MALFKITRKNDGVELIEQYRRRFNFSPFQDNTVCVGDFVYAFQGAGQPVCIDMGSGELVWGPVGQDKQRRAAMVYADGHLFVRRSDGSITLVKADPKQHTEGASFRIPDPEEVSGVTFPVIAGGRLYLRDNNRLLCYDIRGDALSRSNPPPRHLKIVLSTLGHSSASLSGARTGETDAIFVPTPSDVVEKMLELAMLTTNSILYDLGSGDGRIVLAAARRYRCQAIGYEIDGRLAEEARAAARSNSLDHLVRIQQNDLLTADVSRADAIALYLPTNLLHRLRPQLERAKPGARIISHQFLIPGVAPQSTTELVSSEDGDRHRIYVWIAPL